MGIGPYNRNHAVASEGAGVSVAPSENLLEKYSIPYGAEILSSEISKEQYNSKLILYSRQANIFHLVPICT